MGSYKVRELFILSPFVHRRREMAHPVATKVFLKLSPEHGHAIGTLQVHPPTSHVPPFLLTQNLSGYFQKWHHEAECFHDVYRQLHLGKVLRPLLPKVVDWKIWQVYCISYKLLENSLCVCAVSGLVHISVFASHLLLGRLSSLCHQLLRYSHPCSRLVRRWLTYGLSTCMSCKILPIIIFASSKLNDFSNLVVSTKRGMEAIATLFLRV